MDLDIKENFDLIKIFTIRKQQKTQIEYTCKICSKKVSQKGFFKNRFNFECPVCKRQKTNIQKYGKKSIIYEKAKQTFLEKYGVENPSQIKEVQEKRKQTFLERFGTDNPAKNTVIKEKIKNTNLEKYGVTCTLHDKEISEKIKQTNLEKYGTEYYLSSEDKKEKSKQTCLKKYGVIHPMQTEFVKEKILNSTRKNQLKDRKIRSEKIIKSRGFSYKEVSPLLYEVTCKCGETFLWTKYSYISKEHYGTVLFCKKCWKKPVSKYEDKLADILKDFNIERNTRKIIPPKELDIWIPDYNIAIEFDGNYWHNNSTKTLEKYHICNNKGIKLINIFEHEWNEDKIKSVLYSILNKRQNIVYARKCQIKEIDNNLYKDFCNENHLQNYAVAPIRLGLFYNNELIQIMSFSKPRFSNKYQYELIRECSKNYYSIVGGKSKLFKYFIKNYNPNSIISYCDKRYFTGNSYLKLYFELYNETKPSYFYIKENQLLTRYQCQKHKLKNLLDNFDNDLTEEENMANNGFYRLYDFGQYVYLWKK